MTTYLTNRALLAKGFTEVLKPGFEILTHPAGFNIRFWDSFFNAGNIIDRTDGLRARKQIVATVRRREPGSTSYSYRTDPGVNGAIRYGTASNEEAAIEAVSRWVMRRFAHVHPPSGDVALARFSRREPDR